MYKSVIVCYILLDSLCRRLVKDGFGPLFRVLPDPKSPLSTVVPSSFTSGVNNHMEAVLLPSTKV